MAADRSYVTKNREQLERLRALVDKLSDQEPQRRRHPDGNLKGLLSGTMTAH